VRQYGSFQDLSACDDTPCYTAPMNPRVLAIAATDSSGAAGIHADGRAIAAMDGIGTWAITAITAQTRTAVTAVEAVSSSTVAAQIEAGLQLGANTIKTGMLVSSEIVRVVCDAIEANTITAIVDPVLRSTSDYALLDDAGIDMMISKLIPLAAVVTPNISEAEILTGQNIDSIDAMKSAAQTLVHTGCRAALVKGGHASFAVGTDVIFDGNTHIVLEPEIKAPDAVVRGSGCSFASALATRLAAGDSLPVAARRAKRYIETLLRDSTNSNYSSE
jgi:hydroxymethylpyrimidine kinase/phosphomethylpyrimidine kinase